MSIEEIKLGLIRRIMNHGEAKRGMLHSTVRYIVDCDLTKSSVIQQVMDTLDEIIFEDNESAGQYNDWFRTQLIIGKF
jgi:hypothetical protein